MAKINPKITITPYRDCYLDDTVKLINSLQKYITDIDPLKKLKYFSDMGVKYTKNMLVRVSKNQGTIFCALDGKNQVIGLIAGILVKQNKIELLQDQPKKIGTIIELIVVSSHRGTGIGTTLMKTMEKYFLEHGCNWLTVEVFAPNEQARKFYRKHGYSNRSIYMTKPI